MRTGFALNENIRSGLSTTKLSYGLKTRICFMENFKLCDITLSIPERSITAIIGPSGCGKSSFLRILNRMNDLIPVALVEGVVELDGSPIYGVPIDVVELRKKVGMVFQRPNPFPMNIYDNIAFGPRQHGRVNKSELNSIVESSLHQAALWEEVKGN